MFIVAGKKNLHGLVVVTDKEVIGKVFSEGNLQLDLTKDFYKGKEMNSEEMERAYVVHFTGEKAVALGKRLELIGEGKFWLLRMCHMWKLFWDKLFF